MRVTGVHGSFRRDRALAFALALAFGISAGAVGRADAQGLPGANAPDVANVVTITGGWSDVKWPAAGMGGRRAPSCIVYFVSTTPTVAAVRLTTAGLGKARLAPGQACPDGEKGWADEIVLKGPLQRQPIALKFDPETDPPAGGKIEGQLISSVSGVMAGEATLRVWPAERLAYVQALFWALGLLTPALFGLLVAFITAKLDGWRKAEEAFATFRVLEIDRVEGLISKIRIVIDARTEAPGRIVYQEAMTYEVLKALPPERQRELVRLCNRQDLAGIVALMKRLFPEQAVDLRCTHSISRDRSPADDACLS